VIRRRNELLWKLMRDFVNNTRARAREGLRKAPRPAPQGTSKRLEFRRNDLFFFSTSDFPINAQVPLDRCDPLKRVVDLFTITADARATL